MTVHSSLESRPDVWILSELYYPEVTSTGHYMTGIAEALAQRYTVRVLCSRPTYAARGQWVPKDEVRAGVHIHRCWSTTLSKDSIISRVVNVLSISASLFLAGLQGFRRRDVVIVVTNPPLLPFVAAAAAFARRARLVLKVDDVYPDILVAAHVISSDGTLSKVLQWAVGKLLSHCTAVIVLGRDVAALVERRVRGEKTAPTTRVITNWSDTDTIRPEPKDANLLLAALKLSQKYVALHAGNLGRVQDLEVLLNAAGALSDDSGIAFLVIGSGARKQWFQDEVSRRGLRNVIVIDARPREEQSEFLTACDVAVSALIPGMHGVSVPSRIYNHLASGRPVIVVGDQGSEAALTVAEERVGWFVEAGDWRGLAETIRRGKANPEEGVEMGCRARKVAETRFSQGTALARYVELVGVIGHETA